MGGGSGEDTGYTRVAALRALVLCVVSLVLGGFSVLCCAVLQEVPSFFWACG